MCSSRYSLCPLSLKIRITRFKIQRPANVLCKIFYFYSQLFCFLSMHRQCLRRQQVNLLVLTYHKGHRKPEEMKGRLSDSSTLCDASLFSRQPRWLTDRLMFLCHQAPPAPCSWQNITLKINKTIRKNVCYPPAASRLNNHVLVHKTLSINSCFLVKYSVESFDRPCECYQRGSNWISSYKLFFRDGT